MTVAAPPKPKRRPTQPEPEALIEEARRRTRRRRMKYAAAGLAALLVSGAIFGAITLSGGAGSSVQAVPPGFGLVQATGRVTHYVVELSGRSEPTTIDLRTDVARPALVTQEIWWDSKGRFYRVVNRVDGQVTFDLVGDRCFPAKLPGGKLCDQAPVYEQGFSGLRWPLDPKQVHVLGRATFRGRDVVWAEQLVNGRAPKHPYDVMGFDARTHLPFVHRSLYHGRVYSQQVITSRSDLQPSDVSFVVPDGGAPQRMFPPGPETFTDPKGSGMRAARAALGPRLPWLGASVPGHAVRSIRVGTFGLRLKTGRKVRPATFARFDYGTLGVQVFGRARPLWNEHGPPAGKVLLQGDALVSHDGFLVVITGSRNFELDRARALQLAKALRPIPAG
jgi:hypothetical protein